ncbi:MAG: pyruvate/oxaloacetate carboxyltransferase [Candidatus Hermodarchaeota archaeon]
MLSNKPLKITDTVLRDAHQSLLATRMKIEDMLPITEKLDEVGYWSLEMWGGATFDACLRYLCEDPWERLRLLKKAMPNTRMQMLLRGQNILGYRHYPDDVLEKFVIKAAENGIDVFRIFDALNDIRNLIKAINVAKKVGATVEGAISYTLSPVHSVDRYVDFAKKLYELEVDTLCIKDMAALLSPTAAKTLITALKKEVDLPIHLHTHATSGMAVATYWEAIKAGVDIVDTAISSMSSATSQPPTETLVYMMQGTSRDTGLDLSLLSEIADYFKEVRKKYAKFESTILAVDTGVLVYQVPGGMMSNLVNQLRAQNSLHRLDDVLAEVPNVRKDLGYPPLVTPTSQIVGTQAVFNVLTGERYKIIPNEVKLYVRGYYGASPAPVDETLKKMILGDETPINYRPADDLEPEFEKARQELGDKAKSEEDILSYLLFPQVALSFFEVRKLRKPESEPEVVPSQIAQRTNQKTFNTRSLWSLAGRRELMSSSD